MAPSNYRIEVRGRLPAQILDTFAGFHVEVSDRSTTLSGPLADTAALYGAIARLEALGLALVSIHPSPPPRPDREDHRD